MAALMGYWRRACSCKGGGVGLAVCLLGQLVSLSGASAAIFTQVLASRSMPVQMSQVFLFYSTITLLLGLGAVMQGRASRSPATEASMPPLRFFWLTAFFDMEANCCMALALRHTTLTSAMLLGSGCVLPFVLLLGTLVLRQRYRPVHFVATALALAGYVVVVCADMADTDGPGPRELIFGDILCALSAALFACSTLGQEVIMAKGCSPVSLLRRMQPAAAMMAGAQVLLLGSSELPVFWRLLAVPCGAGAPLIGVTASLTLMFSLSPWVIARGGAAFYNVSLLTSNVYGSLWAVVSLGEVIPPLKALGFAAVFAGILIFSAVGPPAASADAAAMALLEEPDLDMSSDCRRLL